MSTIRIAIKIITVLSFIAFVLIIVACDTGQVMIHGSRSIGMVNWNWVQILISLGLGVLIGFLLGLAVSRKKW